MTVRRLALGLLGLLIALIVAAGAFLLFLDSQPGHRLILRQIEQLAPESGLRFRVGRIDGSIYGAARLREVEVFDKKGRFFWARNADLDWSPVRFLSQNRLDIASLVIDRAQLDRLPELVPSAEEQPILPDFDIRIGELRVDALRLAPAVTQGAERTAKLSGAAEIQSGRAMVKLDAGLVDGADRLTIDLDPRPDDKQFDMTADLIAPRDGVLTTLMGIDRGMTAAIRGNRVGDQWKGALVARDGADDLARVALTVDGARIVADGTLHPQRLMTGAVDRLAPDGARVAIDGTVEARRFDGTANVTTRALSLGASGRLDLANNQFGNARIDLRLLQPGALLQNMRGTNVRLRALLEGAIARPRFEYLASADMLAFGKTRLDAVTARGVGRSLSDRILIPVALSARRVVGNGELFDSLLTNLTANGTLTLKDQVLTSDLIDVRSSRASGRIAVLANLKTGQYNVGFDGALPGFEIPGLGRVDIVSKLNVVPAGAGAAAIAGRATAIVRRLDNSFFRTLAGGLPRLDTALRLGADGVLHLNGLTIRSPLLNLRADGYRRPDGTFYFKGRGAHREYGPLTATLDGPIDRPRVTLLLDRPVPAAGLTGVTLVLDPTATGYAFDAKGQSVLGPFDGQGAILLPRGGDTVIDIARLQVANTTARGRLVPVTGGLAGTLAIAGGGLDGTVRLQVAGGVQEIVTALTARDATFPGPPPIILRRGEVNATIRLLPDGPSIDGSGTIAGFQRGNMSIARGAATARMIGGRGFIRGSLAGSRGRDIALQFLAKIEPGAIDLEAQGRVAGRPLRLTRPARFRAEDGGWRVRNAELTFAGGVARVSGLFGGADTEIDATIGRFPLSLIDIAYPDAGVGGRVSGTLTYRDRAGGLPTGTAALKLTNVSRASLAGQIRPIDVSLNAALTEDSLGLRAVFGEDGSTFGRLQARVAPMARGGALFDRVTTAPVFAQLRYGGQAAPLWGLAGVNAIAISGPLALGADVTGTIADPRIRGVLKTDDARIESAQTGTVLTGVKAVGRFDGSRLEILRMSGNTRDGGTVTGTGRFDLSLERGFPYDLQLQANRAWLIERDDIAGRVTGPIRLQADKDGGLITGDVRLDEGRFRLGMSAAADALPVINVREINLPVDRAPPRAASAPIRLDLRIRGRNKLAVTGMGLESEWSTDLTVGGDISAMRILGEANLVRGDYTFAGKRFELERGRIRFTGGPAIDPTLDIVAVSDLSDIDATINIRGTGQKPEISFSSVPALPEDELLSRILFGSSITDISVAEAAQLAAAVASLRGGGSGLDPLNALRKGLGLDRLRILPANTAIGQGTSVAAGKYLTRRLFVEIVTDGQGYSATRAEFQITRWLSILSSISTIGRQSVNARVQKDY